MSKVLYLETDEDISSAVEKLKSSEGAEVSIVVPKRSTLLQSMINLKLLKRAADDGKKSLVLVTTDRLSSHLAGRVGLAVAEKLGAQAHVPETQVEEPDQTEVIDGGLAETGTPVTPETPPVNDQTEPKTSEAPESAALASADAAKADAASTPVMKTKSLEDAPKPDKSKPDKTKKSRVPDFNALQRRIMWAILAVIVIVGLFVANWFLTSASVTVFAKGNQVPVTANFTADPAAPSTSAAAGTLKAQDLTSSKDLSEQVPATGQLDVGTKAGGSITVSNATDQTVRTLPAGTQFSASGKVFDSTQTVTVPGAGVSGGHVVAGTATVAVQADQAGDSYNLAPTNYTITGQTALTASGGQMSGGVSKTVTVVAQSDVDKAVADMLAKDKDGATQDLSAKTSKGNKFINESLTQSQSNVSSDTAVGAQASNVTVKVTVGYDALAIASSDLDALLTTQTQKQAGAGTQVYDDGASNVQFTQIKRNPSGSQALKVTTTASAGPKIDTTAIANQIKGKKYGDATDLIGKLPGVDHADVSVHPSWATSLPSRTSRIKITIKVASSSG